MVSDDALGQVAKGTITLLEKNQTFSEAVANHEAWHYYRNYIAKAKDTGTISKIEQELVDARPSEIARLKKAGYKKSDWGEEIMADEFARYYRTGKTVSEKVKVFFDQIIQKGKLSFEGRSYMLNFVKNVPLAYVGSHRHSSKYGNEAYTFTYMYRICLEIPEGATQLQFPDDNRVAVFAVTFSDNYADDVKAVSPLVSTLY